jgi:hypothetical protein
MTLKARTRHLSDAIDRSGKAFHAIWSDTNQEARVRIVSRSHAAAYAIVSAFLLMTLALPEEDIEASLRNILAVCIEKGSKELPTEPELEVNTVEDTEKQAQRWHAQGEVATYRVVRAQIENVLHEHLKAQAKYNLDK